VVICGAWSLVAEAWVSLELGGGALRFAVAGNAVAPTRNWNLQPRRMLVAALAFGRRAAFLPERSGASMSRA